MAKTIDDVREAEREMERLGGIAESADRLLLKYETATDANRRVGGDGLPFTVEELLEAIERAPEARVSAARARRAAREARAAYEAAVNAERARRGASIHAEMQPLAKKLDAALKACIALNEQAKALDAQRHECRSLAEREVDAACGGAFPRVSLRELTAERYALWRGAMVEEGLLSSE
ncbi:MAG: hypothetical protein ACRD3C_19510 [Vicinamibacterales bacterium]